jgi:hypothetical protein
MPYFIIFKHLFVPKKEVILKSIIIVFKVLHIKLHLSPSPTDGSNYAYTMLSSNIFLIGVLYYNFVGGGGPLGFLINIK